MFGLGNCREELLQQRIRDLEKEVKELKATVKANSRLLNSPAFEEVMSNHQKKERKLFEKACKLLLNEEVKISGDLHTPPIFIEVGKLFIARYITPVFDVKNPYKTKESYEAKFGRFTFPDETAKELFYFYTCFKGIEEEIK